ncbi:MAG: hypothetical protein A2107_08515 [Verrucomicrobia bacterium GWF2_62_7]|nr:MAG: hypothetical protein A2107_08515 [Verrucomicrobia bacterium GWF2_62_7]
MKDILWFLYLYPLRMLVSPLPSRSLYRIGRALEPIFRLVARKKRIRASRRMAVAFGTEATADFISSVSRRYVSNAVYRALDDLTMMHPKASAAIEPPEIHGLEHLMNAVAAGRGVILTSGHFYANRLAKYHLAKLGYPIVSTRNGQPPDGWMGRFGARFLQRRYIEFLHGIIGEEIFIQDPECSLKIFKRLRAGGIVNVHIDANFSEKRVLIPFLGVPRSFATGLLEIARLSGCAVIPLLCLGNQIASSITFGEPVVLAPSQSREEFVKQNLPGLARKLEEQILEHPDQWEVWVRL